MTRSTPELATRARRARAWLELVLLTLSLAALLPACQRAAEQSNACGDAAAAAPVDTLLLAFLSRARNAHHLADTLVDANRSDEAIKTLRELLAGPTPNAKPPAPEVVEVQADTLARLADLESQLEHFELAAQDISAGLELVPENNYYRGHLFEMSGLSEERRAKQLERAGKHDASREAQQRAIVAFETAMRVQAEVIEKALGKASQTSPAAATAPTPSPK